MVQTLPPLVREWHRDLFHLASEGIFVADLDGRCTEVNAAGCRLLGYTRDELVGMTFAELIPSDQRARLADAKRRMLDGVPQVSEWLVRQKGGTCIPVEVSASIVASGRWLAFVRDVRERKYAEAARRLDEQRLRVALACAPISMFNQDRELRYTWSYNPPSPLTPEHIIGKQQDDLTSPETARQLIALKQQVLVTGVPSQVLIEHELPRGRRWFDLRIEPLSDHRGEIVGLTGAAWDVTERKRAEDAQRLLSDASARFTGPSSDWRQLLSDLAPLALRLPCDLCVVDAFDEHARLVRVAGAHADPDTMQRCSALWPPVVEIGGPHLGAEVLRTSEPLLLRDVPPSYLRASAQDDAHLELLRGLELRSLIAVPLTSRGQLLGRVVLGSCSRRFDDEDLRIAIELARRAALAVDALHLQHALQRAVKARDEALAVVAHDLRNPLNVIVLQSEVLASTIEDNSDAGHAIERIDRAARRMTRLIKDLLDVSRLDAGEALTIEAAEVVPEQIVAEAVDAMRPLATAALIELVVELEPGLPTISADRHRLLQVFENVVGNAIKFSPRGACVTVTGARRAREVVFTIADRGCGMSSEQLGHLFDRFWQGDSRDRRGIGLGLSVVKGIIEAHGGRIAVDSEPNRGTAFQFTLPLSS